MDSGEGREEKRPHPPTADSRSAAATAEAAKGCADKTKSREAEQTGETQGGSAQPRETGSAAAGESTGGPEGKTTTEIAAAAT